MSLIQQELKQEIKFAKQQILSALILFFMFLMIVSTIKVGQAATNDTNLVQNLISGTLDMVAPSNLNWTDVTLNASQQYSNTNLNAVNVTDYRGGDGDGWNLTLYAENNLTAGTNNIDITARLNVGAATVTSDDSAQAGSAFMMPNAGGGAEVLMNAGATCGTGVSNANEVLFKLNIAADDVAGDYTAVMVFTVS